MKIFFSLFCLVLSVNVYSQKIIKSNNTKETSWEVLTRMNLNDNCFYSYQRVRKVDNNYSLQLKIMIGRVFAISKDAPLVLTLDDNSTVTLHNTEFNITCAGCGEIGAKSQAQGLEVTYLIAKEDVAKLKQHKVVKVKVYSSDGYLQDAVKAKYSETFNKSINQVE
ncbi:MAG TPA: hypothetical protein VN721_01655 [Flavipsychrobacter sp.]|nr:hypothetical protein [Flavipsychrobacter sp.]